jgi:hypothetical protein
MSDVLRDNELGVPITGKRHVSFTRCPEVAAYWADAGPRDWDEGRGGIISVDRQKLAAHHRIRHDNYWGTREEAEEYVLAPVANLANCIVGTFWLDELTAGVGLMPPRRPMGERYMPATSLAAVVREATRTVRLKELVEPVL